MQIVINIPKEFENHFNSDRFEDSLARVASDIESFGFQLAGRYEKETITMLREALKDSEIIPKGHGKLIAEPTEEDIAKTVGGQNDFADFIRDAVKAVFDNAPTIIEAGKEDKE